MATKKSVKASAVKTAAKKAPAKKVPAKKVAAKKAPAKKIPVKKVSAKKVPTQGAYGTKDSGKTYPYPNNTPLTLTQIAQNGDLRLVLKLTACSPAQLNALEELMTAQVIPAAVGSGGGPP